MPDAPSPHFVLFSQIDRQRRTGSWRFSLQSKDGSTRFEAADREPEARGERLELLTIVRGLEALDQPSRVTVCSAGTYVQRGVRYGLEEWRASDWMWERYGEWVPIKNADLWQRLDRVLQFHQVEFRRYRVDRAHNGPSPVVTRRIDAGQELGFANGPQNSRNTTNRAVRRPWRSSMARTVQGPAANRWNSTQTDDSTGARGWLAALGRALVMSQ